MLLGQAQGVTLTVWTHYVGQDLAWVRAQSAGYARATGVQVRVTSVAFGDLIERWEGARARPDVVVGVPDHWLPGLAAQTAPLAGDDLGDPAGVAALTVDGVVRARPLMADAVALVVNRALVPDGLSSWSDLERAAAAGGPGVALGPHDPYLQAGLFRAFGVNLLAPAPDAAAVSRAGCALRRVGGPGASLNEAQALATFGQGRLGAFLTGPWNHLPLVTSGVTYSVQPLPAPPGAPQSWQPIVGYQGVAVDARTSAPREAEALARHLTRPDAQLALYRAGGRLPAHPAAQEQLRAQGDPWGFIQAVRAGQPEAASGNDSSAWDRAQATLDGALAASPCP
ncbi:maltose ABC transporter substrate-binding protein [Deinococcus arenae]|uniref:Maltose ABC transporter substrate-binding protein n=2 Tax=Deinococcus arenae TaxID=1452751 RepID=A0A8H9GV81_9DEIO|nr:maltose ABC transporter substrate-binding protein [Deinococcus arenae]